MSTRWTYPPIQARLRDGCGRCRRDGESKIAATIDAASLIAMAVRGKIVGAVVDGPLAFDNAINADAASTRAIFFTGARSMQHPCQRDD